MLKKRGKLFFLIAVLALGMLVYATSVFAPLDCQTRNGACLAGETNVFKISSPSNAHAELFTEANYNYNVCCQLNGADKGGDTLSNACGTEDSRVTALSSPTNAHVEQPCKTDYSGLACISAATGTVLCSQKASCNLEETCVFTQSTFTNAHSADCTTDPYSIQTCCRYYPNECGKEGQNCCAGKCVLGDQCDGTALTCQSNVCVRGPSLDCGDGYCDPFSEDAVSCPADCATTATLKGYARNISMSDTDPLKDCTGGCPVKDAVVTVLGKSGAQATTDSTGYYQIVVNFPGSGSPYDITAANPVYETAIVNSVPLAQGDVKTQDFQLLRSLGDCNNDCTKVDGLCHAECQGKGLCSYYSEGTRQACDNAVPGIMSSGSENVMCCTGAPYSPVKANVNLLCGENLISAKIPVLFRGKLVNLVLAVFDNAGCK